MRMIVIGVKGQIARALAERGPAHGVVVSAVGRPELDLAEQDPAQLAHVEAALARIEGDVIVNAAAYTMVDKAESEEPLATKINADGAGAAARAAARRGLPFMHISTDYVFDGALDRPYSEDDPTGPINAYGRSKRAGEQAVIDGHKGAAIFRTSWVYSPFGANFLKTMLRLGETRQEVDVVADQRGAPTSALDLADALIAAARKLCTEPGNTALSGVFHMTAAGEASWADFAEEIFATSARFGRPHVNVRRIAASQYPTPARRPANSRLSNEKLARIYGLALPDWRGSTRACVARLLGADA